MYVDTYSLEESRVSIVADGSCILLQLRARAVRVVVLYIQVNELCAHAQSNTVISDQ